MKVTNSLFGAKKAYPRYEQKAYAREDLVYNVTEDILVAMEDLNVSKKELANRLGKSKSFVSQILSGARNMTLGTLSDICFELNIEPKINIDSTSCIQPIANHLHEWIDDVVNREKNTQQKSILKVIKLSSDRTWEATKQAA